MAVVTFRIGGNLIKGKYYFESTPRALSAQGFFAPEGQLPGRKPLLLNVMASLAFIRSDPRPDPSAGQPELYRPQMTMRTADDRSLAMKIPAVAEFGVDWDYWMLPDGSLRYVSPSCESVTGYTAAEFIARPSLMDEIVADEERAAWYQHRAQRCDAAARRTLEFRIRTREGQTRWVEHICAPVTGPDGSDLGTRGSNRDVTPRKQAEADLRGALLEIQELRDRLEVDNRYMRERLQPADDIEGILGASDAMRYATAKAQQVAKTTSGTR